MINLFPKTYRKNTSDFILNQIENRNKISIQYLYGVGKNAYFQYLSHILQHNFGDTVFNFSVSITNGDSIKQKLSRFISTSNLSDTDYLQNVKTYLASNGLLLLNLQFNYLNIHDDDLLKELAFINTLRNTFTNQVIPIIHYYWKYDSNRLLNQSVVRDLFNGFNIKFKAFDKDTFSDALHYFQKRNRTLTEEEKLTFWEISKGQPIIYKQFFLFCIENEFSISANSFNDFIESQRLLEYKSKLTYDFGSEITSVLQNNGVVNHPGLKDLQQFGLIDENNKFKSSILAKVFAQPNGITTNTKSITDDVFTKIESNIINTLSSNSSIVSRDEIALIIWGDKDTESYSNYAIDKHISNIRTKLKPLSLGEIKTIKGRGYKFIG